MSSLIRIIITGCNGQIGTALRLHPLAINFTIFGCDKNNLDITNPSSIKKAILEYKPHIIINAAAYTKVDQAEIDKKAAEAINYLGVENLARACHEHDLLLFHLSTDYIFDGKASIAYHEEAKASPINTYGTTKLSGENAIRTILNRHIILRVSAVYSEYGVNFLKTILRLAEQNETLNVVSDQITCPTHASHIAEIIFRILKQPHSYGTYHYCDNEAIAWHGFAEKIIQTANNFLPLNVKVKIINAILTRDSETLAQRPLFSVLACDKIQKDYGIKRYDCSEALIQTIKNISKVNFPCCYK